MKKFLLTIALMGGVLVSFAQRPPHPQQEENYAPTAGSFSTEIQFNPFKGSDGVFSNGSSISNGAVFSGTYFMTDKFAVTFDFGLGGTNDKYNVQYNNPDNEDEVTSFEKKYNGTFTLGLGAKYYFYNYKRINLYCGAKVSYFHDFAGYKNVSNVKDDVWSWNNNGTSNGFGIYANTGIDFSIYKGLYVGAEINVGFKDNINTGYTSKNKSNGVETEVKHKAGGHSFNGGFGVSPVFRLGWNF